MWNYSSAGRIWLDYDTCCQWSDDTSNMLTKLNNSSLSKFKESRKSNELSWCVIPVPIDATLERLWVAVGLNKWA